MIYPDNFIKDEIIGAFIEEKIGDKRIPISAGFELTPFCNLNCIHCYLSPSRRAKILTNYQVKRILDILFENGTLSIFFTGGEVLTRHDFKDIYIYAKKKGFLVSILTNATLMSDDIIELFLEYPIEEVSFTMYGKTQETYESITRVPGSYQKFIHGMELLHKNKIPCEFKTVGMKQNLHEFLDIVSL
ncbi:MAG: radical SAM protein, partial [Oscillospiraceae bacterium]|nr:radical SAM protein [Oscillospiraceae bacterium]